MTMNDIQFLWKHKFHRTEWGESDMDELTAALFNPLDLRVQEFVDRRFFRRKYNAELTLARFSAVAHDEVDMDMLTAELLVVVQDTMQPEEASLWLRA